MKILFLFLFLVPAALASKPKDDIAFSTKIIKQNGKDMRVIQPMLPVYFEIEGSDVGLANSEVMMCHLIAFKDKNIGGTGKTVQEDADVECKNGQYKFQVRRVFFETSGR
jgi:hypothetical protein